MTTTPVSSVSDSSLLSSYINSQSAAAASTSTTSNSATNLSSSLNLDFSTYIKILTTQLQNQDPTNATDPNQFTQELVQMGGVQQQITTNTDLTDLLNQGTASSLATGAGYIGNYVAASSSSGQFSLQNSSSEFSYTLGSAATSAIVTIRDASGDTVAQFSGPGNTGANNVSWNGLDASGDQLSNGSYTFSVTATDSSGDAVTVSAPTVYAQVTGVQSNTDGTLELITGSMSVASSDVEALFSPSTLPGATALTTPLTSS